MAAKHIDVWDISTFDAELIAFLEQHSDLIGDYLEIDHRIFLSHDLGRGPNRSILRPENPHASDYHDLKDAMGRIMGNRTIRAFHYTRLTDDEVVALKRDGIYLSTPDALLRRFANITATGGLTQDTVDKLYTQSPFHSDQAEARSDKFWMTSHPTVVDDSGVVPLMEHWGGEVASMWVRDRSLLASLNSLGRPRIIEIAVPISATSHSFSAGEAILATFARSQGSVLSKQSFDLFVEQPLPSLAILAVHSEGEAPFAEMGRSYPVGYVDVDIGRWKELTGEDD